MNLRWLPLLLVLVCVSATNSRADIVILPADPGERVSHRPIGNGLENNLTPEQMLARRLGGPRTQKTIDDLKNKQLNADLQELAKKFLNDDELLKSLARSVKPGDVDRLKGQLGDLGSMAKDPAWREIFEKGKQKWNEHRQNGNLSEKDQEALRKWQQKLGGQNGSLPPPSTVPPDNPTNMQPPQGPPPNMPPPPMPTNPTPPNWDRLPPGSSDWLKHNFDGMARNFTNWLDTPNGQSTSQMFRDMARRAAEARANAPPIGDRLRGIGRYLPRPGNWMISRVMPRISPSLPSLPRLPTATNMPRVSASDAGRTLLIGAVVVLALFLLWRSRDWVKEAIAARMPASWRLGPWPVRPQQVTTRGDLVRAFEYLALLSLGPSARTQHHLELARELGSLPALDNDRRRDSAETLARLYEQARYTPDDEPLSPEQMASARRELSYLAGEQAA